MVMALMAARDGAALGPVLMCLLPSCSDSRRAPACSPPLVMMVTVSNPPQRADFSWLGLARLCWCAVE